MISRRELTQLPGLPADPVEAKKKSEERARFQALDAWRGICAILVVIFHFVSVLPTSFANSPFVANAYLFVDFFFVLSGFVICHSYRDNISTLRHFGQFVVRRFARVWPLHAVTLAVLLAAIIGVNHLPHPDDLTLTWDDNSYSVRALLPNLLLLNSFGMQGSTWNGPAWSIGAEFCVYFLFGALLLIAPRRLVSICIVLSVAALIFIFLRAPDLMNTTWDYGLIRCVAGFSAGVVAYHCYERLEASTPLKSTMIELAALVFVISFVIGAGSGPDHVFAISLAAPLMFAVAVVAFAREGGILSHVLRARPFRALGRFSFSIYLIHQPLLVITCYGIWLAGYRTKAFDPTSDGTWLAGTHLFMLYFIFAVVLIAAFTYNFIEVPTRRRLNRLAGGRTY
jgi:peptidoglycan/LPS O-acetylase OafA/YrhL